MLIKNPAELTANSEINKNVTFDAIKMSIKSAEKKYILPIIGVDQYTDLNAAHNGGSPTTEQTKLIAAIQEPLASLAMALYVPHGEVSLSDVGARRTGTSDLPGAYKYQTANLQAALFQRGFDFIEDLILFLETNIDDYPLWTESEEFAEYRNLFVRSGTEFGKIYTGAKHPRQTFLKLRSALLFVQENIIRPTILPEIYTDLQEKLLDPGITYTPEDKALMTLLQRAMCSLAMKEGMNDYALTIDENGVTVLNDKNDTTMGDVSKKNAASDPALTRLFNSLHNIGYSWLKRATDYLDQTATATTFESWYGKLAAEAETKNSQINEDLSGCFSL